MLREFVYEVSRRLGLSADLIEKDFLLHQILLDLSKVDFQKSSHLRVEVA